MKKNIYILCLFVVLTHLNFGCCQRLTASKLENHDSLIKELSITNSNFNKIKDEHEIIKELKLAIKDSLLKRKALSILDSFFLEEENSKKRLLAILELNRVFKGKNYRIIDVKVIDTTKALVIDNLEDLQRNKKILNKNNNKNKLKIKTDTTKVKN